MSICLSKSLAMVSMFVSATETKTIRSLHEESNTTVLNDPGDE